MNLTLNLNLPLNILSLELLGGRVWCLPSVFHPYFFFLSFCRCCRVDECRFYDSKMRPLLLVYENPDPSALLQDVHIIFKNGDGEGERGEREREERGGERREGERREGNVPWPILRMSRAHKITIGKSVFFLGWQEFAISSPGLWLKSKSIISESSVVWVTPKELLCPLKNI